MLLGKMISKLKRTRVQILLGFLAVMIAVLSVVGGLSYRLTSNLFIRNTETYLEETAVQASARVDAVLAQLDLISLQLVMDARIQQILYQAKQGMEISLDRRLALRPILDNVASLSWLITGIDIYTEDQPLYPLENKPIVDWIGPEALETVKKKAGQLVWIGAQSDHRDTLIAVRQIPLEQQYLEAGGYIVVKVVNSLGDMFHASDYSFIQGSSMHLFDQAGQLIATTSPSMPGIETLGSMSSDRNNKGYRQISLSGNAYLHIIQPSDQVNWTIHMLVPLSAVTESLSVLKLLSLYALIAGILVCLALAWLLSERITKPIRKLRKKMSNVHFALPQTNEETYFNLEMNELNRAYNKLVRDLNRLVETVYEKERLKNQAEIKMLQAQIHPHFLFNTLESLYWNLMDKQDHDGGRFVIALSKLFRYSIMTAEGDDNQVPLHEELEHCRRYLEIMKYRMGQRLEWRIQIDDLVREIPIPKLLIQPLVENAIQHGIEPKIDPGTVTIDARPMPAENGTIVLQVCVCDNGVGLHPQTLTRLQERLAAGEQSVGSGSGNGNGGIGLLNVGKRIRMHYGESYGLFISSTEGQGTEVRLRLPNGGAGS